MNSTPKERIYQKDYIAGSFFYTIPGILSVILSLVSIPIFLKFLNAFDYSNYLIQHFVLTIAIIANLNVGKSTLIKILDSDNDEKQIISSSIILTFFLAVISSTIIYFFFIFLNENINSNKFEFLKNYEIFFGLLLTNIYVTFEFILKSKLHYKILSFCNLLFFGISLSLPCLIIFTKYSNFIFLFSIIIKFFALVLMLYFIKRYLIKVNFKNILNFYKSIAKLSKWMNINLIIHQIYNYFDKYLIKFFFLPQEFIFYSISQQISQKMCVPLESFNNIFITKTKSKGNFTDIDFACSIYLGFLILTVILIYNLMDYFLLFWLQESYSYNYIFFIKVLFLASSLVCFSNLITNYFDINYKSKLNSLIEISLIIPFILGLIVAIFNDNLFLIIFSIIIKEIVLIFMKFYNLKNLKISTFNKLNFLFFIVNIILWYFNFEFTQILMILNLFIFFVFAPYKKIIKKLKV